jgi:hypothetical protein
VPSTVEFSDAEFLQYREAWTLYRRMGHYDSGGAWVPPISFLEALEMPKAMLNTFQGLDHFLDQMQKHREARNPASLRGKGKPKPRGS